MDQLELLPDDDYLQLTEVQDAWPLLTIDDRLDAFKRLSPADAEDLFLSLAAKEQLDILMGIPAEQRRSWIRLLAPDDAADVIQNAEPEYRDYLLTLLDQTTRKEVTALLAYAEDDAGGLMNPRYARLRPDMKVDEAISYLRIQAREKLETLYYLYVLDAEQHLLGVVSFRELFIAKPERKIREIMHTDVISAPEEMDQEALSRLFAQHDFLAVPVVDDQMRMKGIVTIDDIVDVVEEEATEDIQKLGGTSALDAPYLEVSIWNMIKKRGGWLSVLLLGETFTASAMGMFESAIARVVALALFVPLIISSGGNSGSQASTLVIRAMTLGEVKLRDWWRVTRREFIAGLTLGLMLGTIGLVRVVLWQRLFHSYGEHYLLVAVTVAISLVGVVTFGTLTGSILPFILRRFGFDPASASAPLVATLVDVTGLLIYFSLASLILLHTV